MSEDIFYDLFEKPRRRGHSGRIPDMKKDEHEKYENRRYTCPPELFARLLKFCEDEERAQSWVIQKALDKWLKEKGY